MTCLLYLHPLLISKQWQRYKRFIADAPQKSSKSSMASIQRFIKKHLQQKSNANLLLHLPGFDPIETFLKEASQEFKKDMEFFYNHFGGDVIACRFKAAISTSEQQLEVTKALEEFGAGLFKKIVHQIE